MNRTSPKYVVILAKELRQKQTNAELLLWNKLKNNQLNNLKFKRQYTIGRYIADFYCSKASLVIELDGKIHENQKEYDEIREEVIRAYGIQILRFKNEEVEQNIERVIKTISNYL